jgi:phosphoglycerate dehydrogenase-like enzyme
VAFESADWSIMGSQWFTPGIRSDPTIELTWALILASARHIATESNSVRSGGWQQTVGTDRRGETLGVLGLGRIGSQVARIGSAFGSI